MWALCVESQASPMSISQSMFMLSVSAWQDTGPGSTLHRAVFSMVRGLAALERLGSLHAHLSCYPPGEFRSLAFFMVPPVAEAPGASLAVQLHRQLGQGSSPSSLQRAT